MNHKMISSMLAQLGKGKSTLPIAHDDLRFVTDFIRGSAFYIEDLEERLGEDLNDFWRSREQALNILCGWLMNASDAKQEPTQ